MNDFFVAIYYWDCCFWKWVVRWLGFGFPGLFPFYHGNIITIWRSRQFWISSLFLSNEERLLPQDLPMQTLSWVCFQGRVHWCSLYTTNLHPVFKTFVNKDIFLRVPAKYPPNCPKLTLPYSSTQFWVGFTEHVYIYIPVTSGVTITLGVPQLEIAITTKWFLPDPDDSTISDFPTLFFGATATSTVSHVEKTQTYRVRKWLGGKIHQPFSPFKFLLNKTLVSISCSLLPQETLIAWIYPPPPPGMRAGSSAPATNFRSWNALFLNGSSRKVNLKEHRWIPWSFQDFVFFFVAGWEWDMWGSREMILVNVPCDVARKGSLYYCIWRIFTPSFNSPVLSLVKYWKFHPWLHDIAASGCRFYRFLWRFIWLHWSCTVHLDL